MKSLNVTLKGICSDPLMKGEDEVRLRINPSVTQNNVIIGLRKVYNSTPNPKLIVIGTGYIIKDGVNVREVEIETNAYQYITFNMASMDENSEVAIVNAHNINAYVDTDSSDAVTIKDIEDIQKFAANTSWLQLGAFEDYLNIDELPFSKFANISELILNSPNAYGHISNIPSTVKKLRTLKSNITGDISTIPAAVETYYCGGDSKVYGNLALVPNGFQYIWGTTKFNWPSTTSRPTTSKQFGMSYVDLDNDLDNMLVNMASCANNPDIASGNKVIVATGRHTMEESIWQEAVQTLQDAGFTVTLNT